MKKKILILLIILLASVSQSFGQKTDTRRYEYFDNTAYDIYNQLQFTEVFFDFDKSILRITESGELPAYFKINKTHKNLQQGAQNSDDVYLYNAYDISTDLDGKTYKLQARLYQDPYVGFFLMYTQEKFKRFYNKP